MQDYLTVAVNVLRLESSALLRAADCLSGPLRKSVEIILPAKKLVVTGLGKSGLVAKKIAATLCSTGTPAVFLHAAEALHGDLGVFSPGDPTLLISKSGSTDEMIRLLPVLRELNSKLIGLLGNTNSPLAEAVDVVLDGSVEREADPLGIVPTSSTTLAMAIGDALAIALMQARGFGKSDFARFHPGGQLGRNLLRRVSDVMHSMDRVAQIHSEMNMREVIIVLTEYPLGGACVVDENGVLKGLITDGDIRRSLKNHDDFLSLKAEEVMTVSPVETYPDVILGEAIRQMEDRPSQLSVLPVVDRETRKSLGLLRIHDAYQPGLL
jgi:arabinose-5-phosphate isomerase